ncbi:MAG TPA: 16S rRNA (guanine(527)-N(7))-methyltransferase RsmG [Accumulibacter sp.]|uniref:Ribosomal RNA small subunit methyltransferase G n=2 Tax=Candidatus Accumulibacter TaxID=327159 RepID=A0A080MDN5_9PROT|nr:MULTISPECIES: 16S rRNA (guanine(527)-N(7))-methyltransferase RsmG [Candidatus Accumulibacter]KFB78545.1 MAG: Ribosomal RNA small subunit methyltransferase G [Candidatus Accumulibacter cognatus]MBL8400744.1 16S rRNA (guanine(527)-N(7))-methyltransferase RsmG [Accumulibacter sp.]MBN8517137.1 16S rRNA (guanine(527)-N(7))-methyltransferase RsmG [Accumulibacter sp.]MBO3709270.1 16S rRNA (guanine(527)-N(7))-methyltransferase RsmG [Accumulibacter sp.]MCC2869532.1 16S rRNA (guanine(527)-N(7))-methy
MTPATELAQGLHVLGIDLSHAAQNKLLAYVTLLDKWNKTYRLTGLKDPSLAVSHHLLDSLAILPFIEGKTLLDVGSGGGMPGIPLAIARPELGVVLLDSNAKKTAFLQQVAIELGLVNIAVHCGRVEAYRPVASFSAISARAFSDLGEFVRLSRHLLQTGGHWLAMKGLRPQDEMANLSVDVVVDAVHRLKVPGITGERHLVIMSSSQAQH